MTKTPEVKESTLKPREEAFCVKMVVLGDRHLAYQQAGYLARKPKVRSAAITRLLKKPTIKARIQELEMEMLAAQGVTKERVTANLAQIGFNRDNANSDRNSALRTLAQCLGMFDDKVKAESPIKLMIALPGLVQAEPARMPILPEVGNRAVIGVETGFSDDNETGSFDEGDYNAVQGQGRTEGGSA